MGKHKYNWVEVQAYYDEGHTLQETASQFGMKKQNLCSNKRFTSRPKDEQSRMMVATKTKDGTLGHSQATKDRLSEVAISRGFGGKNFRKTFKYNGVTLESSYELAVAQDLDANAVRWIRPKRFYWVDDTGKKRHYTPDFYLPDYDVYLDPKNSYLIKIDSRKIQLCSEQNNIVVHVLTKDELQWQVIKNKMRR